MNKDKKILEILSCLKRGEIIIVTDDLDRENEADMVCAGENLTAENVNIMATYAKGLICTPISKKIADKFNLPQMVSKNTDNHETAFTVSIDHKDTTTGISAYERAVTIKKLTQIDTQASDFRRPGHVFPLLAKKGGVLTRRGHTEATVDLLEMAGLIPVGLCCEIMDDDGHMMRGKKVKDLAKKLNLKMISVEEIKNYKEKNLIKQTSIVNMPTEFGDFRAVSFYDLKNDKEHIALIKGDISKENVLTRIHSECLTGDVFSSKRCDCGSQLHKALEEIEKNGSGILLYMRQEGRGIGLFNKINAYNLQEKGYDTVDANIKLGFDPDLRDYQIAVIILKQLGVKSINLMTNNPDKIEQVEKYKLKVNKRIPIEIKSNQNDKKYLATKAIRMNHKLNEFKGVINERI